MAINKDVLIGYLAAYVQEELDRKSGKDMPQIIEDGIDAFEGGASSDGQTYNVTVTVVS